VQLGAIDVRRKSFQTASLFPSHPAPVRDAERQSDDAENDAGKRDGEFLLDLDPYVDDVDPHTGQWRGVFVADNRSDESEGTTPAQAVDAAHRENPAPSIREL
jgi:hypothetical protein